MTLVRGNRYVEPLELTRQCNGRVNEHGITPQEDEDAPRESFCDVRFDVAKPPPAVYCLWNGKVRGRRLQGCVELGEGCLCGRRWELCCARES